MREEGIALKNRVDVPLIGSLVSDIFAVDENLTCRGFFKPRQEPECCGLAAAARAEEGKKLTAIDIQRYPVNRPEVTKRFGHVSEFNGDIHGTNLLSSSKTAPPSLSLITVRLVFRDEKSIAFRLKK
jgi:hypothetical protein